eukprot:s192_g21.t1
MVDHRFEFPRCIASTSVRLGEDFAQWEQLIRERWNDVLDPAHPLEFHIVAPKPPVMQPGVVAHVILIQAPRPDWVSNLVTVDDHVLTAMHQGAMARLVITTHEHILLEHITQACGYGQDCFRQDSLLRCRAIIQREHLRVGRPWPGRSGYSIHLLVERYTREFLPGVGRSRNPRDQAQWMWLPELQVLLFPPPEDHFYHYFYVDEQNQPFHFNHYDCTAKRRDDIGHMRWLYQQGYQRAALVQPPREIKPMVVLVIFCNAQPQLPHVQTREPTPWPASAFFGERRPHFSSGCLQTIA